MPEWQCQKCDSFHLKTQMFIFCLRCLSNWNLNLITVSLVSLPKMSNNLTKSRGGSLACLTKILIKVWWRQALYFCQIKNWLKFDNITRGKPCSFVWAVGAWIHLFVSSDSVRNVIHFISFILVVKLKYRNAKLITAKNPMKRRQWRVKFKF